MEIRDTGYNSLGGECECGIHRDIPRGISIEKYFQEQSYRECIPVSLKRVFLSAARIISGRQVGFVSLAYP